MNIYVFGNEVVKKDSNPLKLLPALKKAFPNITFFHVDPTESWNYADKNPIIIDTVEGLKKVTVFTSLENFQDNNPRLTPHDYDVYTDLILQKKLGKIQKVTVIGIPIDVGLKITLTDLNSILSNYL
jgi:hypothetical protein